MEKYTTDGENMKDRMQIGVIGSWRNTLDKEAYRLAEDIGKEIAQRNCILITGGSTGVMEHSMKGCKDAGGTTVGIIAADDYRAYEYLGQFIDIKINTGMGENGRIPVLVNTCDAVIAIGGGVGTLTEIAHAYHQGKPVVIMEGTGGVSDKVRSLLDKDGYLDTKRLVKISFAQNATDALTRLISAVEDPQKRSNASFGPSMGNGSRTPHVVRDSGDTYSSPHEFSYTCAPYVPNCSAPSDNDTSPGKTHRSHPSAQA